jgi:hypothetical protein
MALLILPSITMVSRTNIFTVGTDKQVYRPGENVVISGAADADVDVFIDVFDGIKTLFNLSVISQQDTAQQVMAANSNAGYSVVVSLPEDSLLGVYTVTAIVGEDAIKTMFTVTEEKREVQIATGSDSTYSKDLAEIMLVQTGSTREQVNKTVERLKDENVELPDEAIQNLNLGVEKEKVAQELFDAGNLTAAEQSALSALRLYGEAYKIIAQLLPDATTSYISDLDSGELSAQGLLLAIDRAFSYLGRVEKTADRLEEEGYTLDTEVRLRLDEAIDSLMSLKEELESGEVTVGEGSEEHGRIRALLGQTMGLLHRTAVKDHKKAMAERFTDYTQSRILGLNDKIRRLAGETGNGQFSGINISLGNMLSDMNRARERLAADDVDDVVVDLDIAANKIDDDLDKLNGEGLSFKLKAINSIEARIMVLRATAERLSMKGLNTTTIFSELEEAEKILEDVMGLLEEGDIEAAEELLGAAVTHSQNASSDILSNWRGNNSDATSTLGSRKRISDTD